jgi:cobalt-zinc-cadmium efflux system outer membrane protein
LWAAVDELTLPESPIEGQGPSPAQLVAFAVEHHPALLRARGELGVTEALIIEAGLWPGLEVGWGGMDALASEVAEDHTKSVDYLSGFDLMFQLPRPGELDAKETAARWRAAAARAALMEAEWQLGRDVLDACVELGSSERLLAATVELGAVAERTAEYFTSARDAGAATRTEASLALGEVLAIRVDHVELEARVATARRALNGLLGVRPGYEFELSAQSGWLPKGFDRPLARLEEEALASRPELASAQALFAVSEAELRLEIARQFPLLAVGTGLSIQPGLFSHFNRPAIETAERRREVAAREVAARVFEVHAEVFDALMSYRAAKALRELIEVDLMANAKDSLAAAEDSFSSGAVTLVETLNVQRALVSAKRRLEQARAGELRAAMRLATVTGRLAGSTPQHPNN